MQMKKQSSIKGLIPAGNRPVFPPPVRERCSCGSGDLFVHRRRQQHQWGVALSHDEPDLSRDRFIPIR